ncbi:MAG: NAD(P)H-dependent oxidoreductase subunit E [Devosia sp.]
MSIEETRLEEIIRAHQGRDGPLLPILNDIQDEFGCIDEAARRRVADALNLTRAEVHGVVSFYHDYTETAETRPIIKLCRAEACQARGSEALAEQAEAIAGDKVRVQSVYCLGLCAIGPAAMIGKDVHARLDGARIAALVDGL